MKKTSLMILLAGMMCFSCEDFLDEVPRDELSANQNFTLPAHAYNAVNSLYRNGAPQLFDGGVYGGAEAILGNYMSGFFDNEYKGQEVHVQHAQQLTLNGNNLNGYLGGIWDDLYRGISRANNAIKYIPTTPGLTEEESNRLAAEARFFRAYAYFYLVRMFGEVPVITEPYESLDNLYVERNSVKEVYNLIEEDLKFAVNQGGLAEISMANNGNRITKGAAATLLADVYLTMSGYPLQENRYADAAAMAETVINSGAYSLTQHDMAGGNVVMENSAYNKIRKSDAAANEYVLFHEYAVGISNNSYPQWSYPVSMAQHVAYALTNGAYQPVDAFLWGYDTENDLRAQEKQYFHTTLTLDNGTVQTFEPTPYIWHDDNAMFETASSGKDVVMYSYSDVLLTAAEAIAKSQGVTADAVNYLAQVKGRAYWKQDMNQIRTELASLSADEFVEEVWEERYRELVFEFRLWFDMVRTRKYPETSASNPGEINFVELVGHANTWNKVFEEKHLLFPIPEAERQRNPSLGAQNPGY
ncbi:RagB/SusD family nutrient uptake outer membrane protein [Pontibacter anaerobius]|uniref:RagB/SusD family nutrient uptake outer membrane protein n=1 Tax=Pontibacter anaerobius TaxID=2993940 RepID=A0ABT3RE80_9BACT|nr:RagB/SusD family nutrient uptake outer membrane protein [Pontibacter anaerobius]MCX2739743.1 RagB/SusD family nutrient uptake outer membrane protein [Pontibacter anaerobius]